MRGLAFWGMDCTPKYGTPSSACRATRRCGARRQDGLPDPHRPEIEISMMFLYGIAAVSSCPRIGRQNHRGSQPPLHLGTPGRVLYSRGNGPHTVGALTWEYWWWSTRFPFLLLLVAYWPLFLVSFACTILKRRARRSPPRRRCTPGMPCSYWSSGLMLLDLTFAIRDR